MQLLLLEALGKGKSYRLGNKQDDTDQLSRQQDCGKVGELSKLLHDSELERGELEEKYKEMELLGTYHNMLPSCSCQLKWARLHEVHSSDPHQPCSEVNNAVCDGLAQLVVKRSAVFQFSKHVVFIVGLGSGHAAGDPFEQVHVVGDGLKCLAPVSCYLVARCHVEMLVRQQSVEWVQREDLMDDIVWEVHVDMLIIGSMI